MPIRISKKMQADLPDEQKADIKDFLWTKSGGRCHLCDEPLNKTTDSIVADHDLPEAESGDTSRENLHLVHSPCNSAKRNNPSIEIRPYLRLRANIERRGDPVYYTDCLPFFDIKPKPVTIDRGDGRATFHLPDGSIREVDVFTEVSQDGTIFDFVFVELPRNAIYNDDECQPRSIKTRQLLLIYSDLSHNPLHEPPGLRILVKGKSQRLVMFDGQHKTLAKWMASSESIVAKVYLNLDKDQANFLVNSVQSRVKKLPLTPLELAAKMADEFSAKYEEYAKEVGDESSEAGFIRWLSPNERNNGKTEVRSAVVNLLRENDDPEIEIINRVGASSFGITQQVLVNKIFKPLATFAPLEAPQAEADRQRARERHNIAVVLNLFEEICVAPGTIPGASANESERSRRLLYQASLDYCLKLVKGVVANVISVEVSDAMLEQPIKGNALLRVQESLVRLRDHPVWTASLSEKQRLREVEQVLSKNQGADKVFKAVGLKLGYLTGVDELDEDWAG